MKKLLLALLAVSLYSFTASAQSEMPDATVSTLDGKSASIKSFVKPDKITVLSFWATWCHPCKEELTNISKHYKEWQEKYNMELIAVSIDNARNIAKIPAVISSKGWEYIVLSDKNEDLKRAMAIENVPFTFIIKDGNIVWSHNGYVEGDEEELEKELQKLSGK